MPKLNPAVKMTIVAVALGAIVYAGFKSWGYIALAGYEPTPVKPGAVNLIAFETGNGIAVRVANRIAQIVETEDTELTSASNSKSGPAKRLPIKELLGSLQGDEEDLSYFVSIVNGISPDDLPPVEVIWTEADLKAAIASPGDLRTKLESNLNMHIDGQPLDSISMDSIYNGIVIVTEVPVQVRVGDEVKTLTAKVKRAFQPRFAREIEDAIGDVFEPSRQEIIGTYNSVADRIKSGELDRENIAATLTSLIDPARKKRLASKPEQILQRAKVLANESMMLGAELEEYKDEKNHPLFDLTIHMTEEGRKRLWKHSRDTKGFELMLTVDGVAVAAPRVTTELAQRYVKITQMRDEGLARMTSKRINELAKQTE